MANSLTDVLFKNIWEKTYETQYSLTKLNA